MTIDANDALEDWWSRLDLAAIADLGDKLAECEFFLAAASSEPDRQRFRWLISAFFNAAYSYFETSALAAYFRFTDPETGAPVEDSQTIEILRRYIKVCRNEKKPNFVKTAGLHPITKKLYQLRKENTHHFALSIMVTGSALPEDFAFGSTMGEGTLALSFCRSVVNLIHSIQEKIDA